MVDPKVTSQKAQEILKSMNERYDDSGNMTVEYFEALEKGYDELKRLLSGKKKEPEQPAPSPATPVAPKVDSSQPAPKVEVPPVTTPSEVKGPVTQAPVDSVHQAKKLAEEKPAQPMGFDDELYGFAQQHKGLKDYVKRFDKNDILNYTNARATKMVKDGEISNELDMDVVQRVLKRLNVANTPEDFFEAMYEISGTVLSPEAAPPTDVRNGKVVSPSKFVNTDVFRHIRNSVNAHLPMTPEIKDSIMTVFKRHADPELEKSPMFRAFHKALEENQNKSLKEVGKAIGREFVPLIGNIYSRSGTTPEEQALREQANVIGERLRNVFGIQTYIAKSKFGPDAFLIKESLGLPLAPEEQQKLEQYRQKYPVKKSLDEFGDNIYDEGDFLTIER